MLDLRQIKPIKMKRVSNILFASMLSVALVSCGGESSNSGENNDGKGSKLSGKVKIDGSSTVFPISEAVFEEYAETQNQPDVKVIVNSSGTGGGFKKFCAGETDINDASRPIKEKEIKKAEEAKIKYVELKVAYDGLAVVVSKKNSFIKSLTVEELKTLWSAEAKETITTWNQVNESFPEAEIKLYGPGTASGTFDYFNEAIIGKDGSSRSDYSPNEDDNVLVNGIAGNENALGYFGLAYYEENKDKLNLVGVDGGKGVVSPSLETVKSGEYAPLSRPLFIYVSSEAIKKPAVVDFVNFYLKSAKELSKEVGYIPLQDAEYEQQVKLFKEFCEANK